MLGQRQPRLQLPHPRPGSNGVEHGWTCLEQMRRPLRSSEGFPSQSPRRVLTRHHSRPWPLAHKPPPRPHPVSSWQCLAEHVLPKPPRTTGRTRALRPAEPRHHGETAPERCSHRAVTAKAKRGGTVPRAPGMPSARGIQRVGQGAPLGHSPAAGAGSKAPAPLWHADHPKAERGFPAGLPDRY